MAGAAWAAPANPVSWAFPTDDGEIPVLTASQILTVPGSSITYRLADLKNHQNVADWFPDQHPASPAIVVHGGNNACGYCHLVSGEGRTENTSIAGLPADYILQQLQDMKSGARAASPFWRASGMMIAIARQVSDSDLKAAADYFGALSYQDHIKVVESATVPQPIVNHDIYMFATNGAREPLGARIIEGPDNRVTFAKRSPNATYTAYVPVGAVARGKALAQGSNDRPACASCHGDGLTGSALAPPIAGRSPTGLFRQLWAFQAGIRHGANTGAMAAEIAGMPVENMIDLAAYAASLGR